MPKIPSYQLQQVSIPGPGSVPQPRATAVQFGGLQAEGLQRTGQKIEDWTLKLLEKQGKDNADLYVSKITSEQRNIFTKRAIELRKTTNKDISPDLEKEMMTARDTAIKNAPNEDGARRTEMSLNSIFSTMRATSMVQDEKFRSNRLILESEKTHQTNRATVYQDFTQLGSVIAGETALINNLDISVDDKNALIQSRTYALGYDAFQGSIDSNEEGAKKALAVLKNPEMYGFGLAIDPKTGKKKYKDVLRKEDRQKLIRYADTVIESHKSDARQKLVLAEKMRTMAQRTEKNRLMELHEDGVLTNEDIKDSTLDAVSKEWIRSVIIKDASGDPPPPAEERAGVFTNLYDMAGDLDQEDLYSFEDQVEVYRESRHISDAQMSAILKIAKKPRDEARKNITNMAKSLLVKSNPMMGIHDFRGEENYAKAMIAITKREEEYEEEGKPLYNLYNPSHDDYVGGLIDSFKRTNAQIMADLIPAAPAGADPSVPTEAEASILGSITDALGLGGN